MLSSQADIQFKDVSYCPQGRSRVDHLSFQVLRGEVLVLLGRSGSGKTTTLKLMNGLLMPTEGCVMIQGTASKDWDVIELRRRMGYVIQGIGLLPHLTIEENVGLVPSLLKWPPGTIQSRVFELLEQVGLSPTQFGKRYPRQLSGGQQQRVGVARALAARPSLLLMDEPFGALDPITRFEIQSLFQTLHQSLQFTAVLITHDIQEALRLGDRIGLLQDGKLVAMTTSSEFMSLDHPEAIAFQRTVMS